MKSSRFFLTIGLVGCLLALPLVEARAAQQRQPSEEPGITDWNNLRQVRIGDKVEVVQHNLSKHKGELLDWTEKSITLRLENRDVTIPREDVFRVTQLSKNHRLRNSMIGLGLGVLVGAATGVAVAVAPTRFHGNGLVFPIATFIGAGVGAGVGAAISSYPTIYRASSPKQ